MNERKRRVHRCGLIGLMLGLWAAAGLAAAADWAAAGEKLRALPLPAESAQIILARAQERGVDAATVMTWAETLARLQQQGVPVSLAGERIVQGLVKGAPAARISQALEVLQGNLVWAKRVIEQHAAKAEMRAQPASFEQTIKYLEAALRSGLERGHLERILGENRLTLGQIAALARLSGDLRSWGLAPERIGSSLRQAGEAGMTATELDASERKFILGLSSGKSAQALLIEFNRDIEAFRAAGAEPRAAREGMREDIGRDSMPDFKNPMPHEVAPATTPGGGYPGGY